MSNDQSEVEETGIVRRVPTTKRLKWKLMRPFYRWVDKTHGAIASTLQLEYDAHEKSYLMSDDHWANDPDDYDVGHTAGKIAAVFGLIPVVLAFILIWGMGHVISFLAPGPAAFSLSMAGLVIGVGYTLAAVVRLVEIKVWFQVTGDRGAE